MKRNSQSSGGTLAVASPPYCEAKTSTPRFSWRRSYGAGWAIGGHGEPCKNRPVAFCGVDLNRTSKASSTGGARLPGLPRDVGEGRGQDRCGHDRHSITCVPSRPSTPCKNRLCQKPLTHTVWEARQVGTGGKIGHDHTHERQIHYGLPHGSGARTIGCNWKSKTVHSWIVRRDMVSPGKSDTSPSPPPKGLAWDLWLGVAPSAFVREDLPSLGMAGLAGFRERGSGRLRLPRFGSVFTALKIEQAPTRVKCSMPPA